MGENKEGREGENGKGKHYTNKLSESVVRSLLHYTQKK
jgi:hypothetical protein